MPQRWAIRFAIEGDLRFVSHHDTARAVERIARRAKVPLRYSQGFNPRPSLSVACPRPVGAAGAAELLVLALEEPMAEGELLARLGAAAPEGMKFLSARELAAGVRPHPCRIECVLPLASRRAQAVASRLDELQTQAAWVVRRNRGPQSDESVGEIDLRPMVSEMALHGNELRFTLCPMNDRWARPGEVLDLLGLDPRADLAALTRTSLEFDSESATSAAAEQQDNRDDPDGPARTNPTTGFEKNQE